MKWTTGMPASGVSYHTMSGQGSERCKRSCIEPGTLPALRHLNEKYGGGSPSR